MSPNSKQSYPVAQALKAGCLTQLCPLCQTVDRQEGRNHQPPNEGVTHFTVTRHVSTTGNKTVANSFSIDQLIDESFQLESSHCWSSWEVEMEEGWRGIIWCKSSKLCQCADSVSMESDASVSLKELSLLCDFYFHCTGGWEVFVCFFNVVLSILFP